MCWSCDNPGGDYLRQVVLPIIERAGWMVQYVEPVADSGQPLTAGQHVAVGLHAMEVVRLAEPVVHLVTAPAAP